MWGRDNLHEYLVINTWETKGCPLIAHQCDFYFEAGKKKCEEIENICQKTFFYYFYLQHSTIKTYTMKVRHNIVHTDLTTEIWTYWKQILFNKWNR